MNFRVPALALAIALAAAAPLSAQLASTGTAGETAQQDSARQRIRSVFRQVMASHGISNSDALVMVTQPRGAPFAVRVLEGTVPPSALAALDSVVKAEAAHWPDGRLPPYALRPEEEEGFDDTVTVIAPELRRGSPVFALTRYLQRHPELGVPRQLINLEVRGLVSRTGVIAYVEMSRSSGKVQIDEELMAIVRRMRMIPARVSNRPVDVWFSLPVTLEFPEPAQPQPNRDASGQPIPRTQPSPIPDPG
ncbi:MAG TPA: energy transducer TonB [Longimicrobium sp.]|jgi:TonB family protein